MFLKRVNKCLNCGEYASRRHFLDLGNQTIQGAFVTKDKPKPPRRKIPLRMWFCESCGLVQNQYIVSPVILYSSYFYESDISNTMREHLKRVANDATKFMMDESETDLKVQDIGCNDLSLLKQYPNSFERIGIDPSDIAKKAGLENPEIEVINECFPPTETYPNGYFNIITSLACFYDISNPVDFCKAVKYQLNHYGIWICEFGYLLDMIKNLAYNQFLHEHCANWSLSTFKNLVESVGMKVIRAFRTPINAGSIQVWLAHNYNECFVKEEWNREIQDLLIEEFDAELDSFQTYKKYAKDVENHFKELKKLIITLTQDGNKIHILAASTKLNVILQVAEIGPDLIPFASERTPRKIGGETLSGIKMISEKDSLAMKPDYYLCGINGFDHEITTRYANYLLDGGKIIFTSPNIRIISKENL